MTSTPLISILIPCYNAAPWLHRCLDSVLAQTYTNWEAICVNDGSFKDNTAEILEEYAAKDARFKVIHQENRGLAGARNTGLRHMTGEWMTWVDADDAVLPQHLTSLLLGTNTQGISTPPCDLVISKNLCIYESGAQEIIGGKLKDATYTSTSFVPHIIPQALYGGTRSLYRTSFLKEHNITFNESVAYAEDYLFNQECIVKAKRANTISATNYLYYIRESADSVHKVKGTIAQEMALFSDRLRLNRALRQRFPQETTTLGKELANTLARVLDAIFLTQNISHSQRISHLDELGVVEQDIATTNVYKKWQHRFLLNKNYRLLHYAYHLERIKVKFAQKVRSLLGRQFVTSPPIGAKITKKIEMI